MLCKALLGMLAILATSQANAAVMQTSTQTITLPQGDGNSTLLYTGGLFDTNLGTLLAVNFSAAYGFTATIMMTNTGTEAITGFIRPVSAIAVGSSRAVALLFESLGVPKPGEI